MWKYSMNMSHTNMENTGQGKRNRVSVAFFRDFLFFIFLTNPVTCERGHFDNRLKSKEKVCLMHRREAGRLTWI